MAKLDEATLLEELKCRYTMQDKIYVINRWHDFFSFITAVYLTSWIRTDLPRWCSCFSKSFQTAANIWSRGTVMFTYIVCVRYYESITSLQFKCYHNVSKRMQNPPHTFAVATSAAYWQMVATETAYLMDQWSGWWEPAASALPNSSSWVSFFFFS